VQSGWDSVVTLSICLAPPVRHRTAKCGIINIYPLYSPQNPKENFREPLYHYESLGDPTPAKILCHTGNIIHRPAYLCASATEKVGQDTEANVLQDELVSFGCNYNLTYRNHIFSHCDIQNKILTGIQGTSSSYGFKSNKENRMDILAYGHVRNNKYPSISVD
jgi:hypothetical protein